MVVKVSEKNQCWKIFARTSFKDLTNKCRGRFACLGLKSTWKEIDPGYQFVFQASKFKKLITSPMASNAGSLVSNPDKQYC